MLMLFHKTVLVCLRTEKLKTIDRTRANKMKLTGATFSCIYALHWIENFVRLSRRFHFCRQNLFIRYFKIDLKEFILQTTQKQGNCSSYCKNCIFCIQFMIKKPCNLESSTFCYISSRVLWVSSFLSCRKRIRSRIWVDVIKIPVDVQITTS